ncbi:MAG: hypothetical protein H0T76_02535 [Nannocystis sp.]|nr:hypothetical protein [Nannocystis sp.]MBA3545339.1 hypothetical protein [Nannocystis sp.]
MTLIEPLLSLMILGSAIGAASVAICQGMGPVFVVFAALAGGLTVPVVLGAVVYVICAIEAGLTGRPYWPACTACGAVDFELEPLPGPATVRCGCGQRYVRHGRQCRQALPGGASRPHFRWRVFRGWAHDNDASSTAPADPPYRRSAGE